MCSVQLLCKSWTSHGCVKIRRNHCPWCYDSRSDNNVSWIRGNKVKHIDHLENCVNTFIETHRVFKPVRVVAREVTVENTNKICEDCLNFYTKPPAVRDMRNRSRLKNQDDFYENVFENCSELLFSNDGKNIRGNYLKDSIVSGLEECLLWMNRFTNIDGYLWYHLSVRALAFETFKSVIQDYANDVCLLPYRILLGGVGRGLMTSLLSK